MEGTLRLSRAWPGHQLVPIFHFRDSRDTQNRPTLPHKQFNFYIKQTLLTQIIQKVCAIASHEDKILIIRLILIGHQERFWVGQWLSNIFSHRNLYQKKLLHRISIFKLEKEEQFGGNWWQSPLSHGSIRTCILTRCPCHESSLDNYRSLSTWSVVTAQLSWRSTLFVTESTGPGVGRPGLQF